MLQIYGTIGIGRGIKFTWPVLLYNDGRLFVKPPDIYETVLKGPKQVTIFLLIHYVFLIYINFIKPVFWGIFNHITDVWWVHTKFPLILQYKTDHMNLTASNLKRKPVRMAPYLKIKSDIIEVIPRPSPIVPYI